MLPSGENCGMVRGRKQVTDPMQYESIFPARFLSRPNRFTALCRLEDGTDIICHVRNTGRCAELFRPGCRVWVQHNPSPTRKTAWTLITVDKDGVLVNVDSLAPNKLFAEAVTKGILVPASLSRVEQMRSEVKLGSSRLDWQLTGPEGRLWCEVKGVTLEQDGTALFPDAPTLRGLGHVETLRRLRSEGDFAMAAFLVQMEGIRRFRPNTAAQPDFARALREAREAGVEIVCCGCRVTPDSVEPAYLIPVEL